MQGPSSWYQRLKHEAQRADRFSTLEFDHTTCQEERTVGMHIGSTEITKQIQGMIKDLEGTILRREKVVIYSRGKQHNIRHRKCLAKLYGGDQTSRTDKCTFMIITMTLSESA